MKQYTYLKILIVAALILPQTGHALEVARYTFDSLASGMFSSVGAAPSSDADSETSASDWSIIGFGLYGSRCWIQNDTVGMKLAPRDIDVADSAINTNKGWMFTVTPSGPISLSSFSFDYAKVATGVTHFAIQYKIGSGPLTDLVASCELAQTGSTSTFSTLIISLSDVSELQNVAQPVTFTFHVWGAASQYAWSACFDNFVLETADPATSVDFDGFVANTNINGLPQGDTSWGTSSVVSPSFLKVVSDFAYDGSLSLCYFDGEGHRLNSSLSLLNAGYTPNDQAAQWGKITFWTKEDPNDAGEADEFEVAFGNLAVRRLATDNLVITLKNKTLADGTPVVDNGLYFGLSSANYVYDPAEWNKFTIEFDDALKTALFYVNDGYLGCQALRPGETGDFTIDSLYAGSFSLQAGSRVGDKVYFDAFSFDFNLPAAPTSWRSQLYPENWTPGYTDAQGRRLQDFSYAGYQAGEVPIPNVAGPVYDVVTSYGADPTGTVDSTAAIQAAIDAVGALPGGGVVFLPAGTYKVAPQGGNDFALQIRNNNVVLRGAGPENTKILNTATYMRLKSIIHVPTLSGEIANWYGPNFGQKYLTNDVPLGGTVLPVNDTSGIAVGDLITLRNDATLDFIDEIGNTGLLGWIDPSATIGDRMLAFARRVVSVTANTITVDVPIRYPVKVRDNGRVVKIKEVPVQEVGLEDFSIGMIENPGTLISGEYKTVGTAAYEVNNAYAILFTGAENCWIKNVDSFKPDQNSTYHLLSGGIQIRRSRFITVESCDLKLSQFRGAGGNGYLFMIAGEESLFRNCTAEDGRHNYSFSFMPTSGNVILECYSKRSLQSSDFHQFFSMANLIDCMTLEEDAFETRRRTEGWYTPSPGETSTESVFWNTTGVNGYVDGNTQPPIGAVCLIRSEQFGNGYIIGTSGAFYGVYTTDYTEGVGKGDALEPQSLYLDQRYKRLGF